MKRYILSTATVLALSAGALFAQSTLNTTAPGPSQETKPGQTNNNLQNPGSNMQQGVPNQNGTYQEKGTVEGTAAESNQGTTTGTTTGTTGTMGTMHPETETGTGVDVDVDTGDKAQGAVDVDVTRTTDSDTDASGTGTQTTGSYNADDNGSLPATASNEPLLALLGLLALGGAFAVRSFRA